MTEDKSKYDPKPGENQGTGDQNDQDYKKLYKEAQTELSKSEKSYIGLQQTLQTKSDELKALNDQFTELQKQFSGTTTQLTALKTEKETIAATLEEKEISLDAATTEARRSKMILKEFPDLAAFEAKGLLPATGPDDAEDKLKELFGSFRDTMKTLTGKQADEITSGGAPRTEPDSSAASTAAPAGANAAKAHLDKATAFALAGDTKGYDAEFSLYQAEKYKGKPVENTN
jgi:hypothetical protein